MADRWFPDGDVEGANGPFIESPGPEMVLVEDLDTLEAVMGRPIPAHIRDELIAESRCYPFTPEMREAWQEESAFGITRLHPSGEWIETLRRRATPTPLPTDGCQSPPIQADGRADRSTSAATTGKRVSTSSTRTPGWWSRSTAAGATRPRPMSAVTSGGHRHSLRPVSRTPALRGPHPALTGRGRSPRPGGPEPFA